MKRPEQWQPSKYQIRDGRLRASTDGAEVSPGSVLMTELIALHYDRYLPRYCNGQLLDLGCGKVPLYGHYRHRVRRVTTADWANTPHGAEHVDHEVDLNRPIDLAGAAYDVIILSDVLEHLLRPQVLWGELARLLRPGGVVLLNVPFMYWLHEQPHDYHRYTEHALRAEARQVGLEVIELLPVGGLLEVMADMTGKAVGTVPVVGPMLARAIQATAFRLYTGRGGARSAAKWPLAYFMVARKPAPVE